MERVRLGRDTVSSVLRSLYGEGNASILDVTLSDEALRSLGLTSKDDPGFQRERIKDIAADVFPNGKVVFDSRSRFRG